MNKSSSTAPLLLNNNSDGSSDHHDNISITTRTVQPRELPLLDGIRPHNNCQSHTTRTNSYADTLKFCVGGTGNSQVPTSEPPLRSQPSRGNLTGVLPLGQTFHLPEQQNTDPPMSPYPQPSHMEELLACCLIGKIWGDPHPLPAIIYKTKKDWFFVKGQVDYIDAGNDWIMLRFANAEDRMLAYDQRPWHVNGLNFVIQKWTPFFDSYSAFISRIDQWVKVPRLPWEFWDHESLAVLMKPMGPIV